LLLEQLIHHGIVIPEPPKPVDLPIVVRGEQMVLSPEQQEMALAWAKKKDTPYVKDPVFIANFMRDFSAALGVDPVLKLEEVDFSAWYAYVDAAQEAKAAMSKEERKALAAERKAQREVIKAKYGYAIVNGQRVELGAYMAEPSGIFMGRGQHPLRGRWKQGACQADVTLNLSPDAPPVDGDWREIVWQPESLWVARWKDRLTGKLKYVWLSDTAPVKQAREAAKFDKALELDHEVENVREQIRKDLVAPELRRRMIATACYLIDVLCLRVGDEKDPDEADTVGATTLRPEHVTLREDGVAEFKFLGKDSVEWHKTLEPPQVVLDNLEELIRNARPGREVSNDGMNHSTRDLPQLFPGITSRSVNVYLSGIMPGLTAKVFRTHHATCAVRDSLSSSGVCADDPEYKKWQAAGLANLEAAVLCNHTKKYTGDWQKTRERYALRRQKGRERIARYRNQVQELSAKVKELKNESREKMAAAKTPERRKKTRERYAKRIASAQRRLDAAKQRRVRAQISLNKINAQFKMARNKRTWNLGTSLKSYIDPRVTYEWGTVVDYDILGRYYPSALRRKFHWVRTSNEASEDGVGEAGVTVRTAMSSDLADVARLFGAVSARSQMSAKCRYSRPHRPRAVRGQHAEMELPREEAEIAEAYLPALEKDWREAIIAIGEQEQIVGFAAIGPEWAADDGLALDIFCVMHPDHAGPALADAMADQVRQRFQAYLVHCPAKKRPTLRPRDERWFACFPYLKDALGLGVDKVEEKQAEAGV